MMVMVAICTSVRLSVITLGLLHVSFIYPIKCTWQYDYDILKWSLLVQNNCFLRQCFLTFTVNQDCLYGIYCLQNVLCMSFWHIICWLWKQNNHYFESSATLSHLVCFLSMYLLLVCSHRYHAIWSIVYRISPKKCTLRAIVGCSRNHD